MDRSLEHPDKSQKAEVASRSSRILPFSFVPVSLFLFLPFLSCAISIHTFLWLIGLEALQRDLNKIISLLLSPQYNRQNPSEKRQTKWVRKCVGNEVRPLKQSLNQLDHYERVLEYSFITADCWLFWLGHQRCQGKRLRWAVGSVAGHQGVRFRCLSFTFFANTPHRATLENQGTQPQAANQETLCLMLCLNFYPAELFKT